MHSSEITSLHHSQVDLKKHMVFLIETQNTMSRTVPLYILTLESFKQAINNPVQSIDTDLIFFREPDKTASDERTTTIKCG
ncbi:Uncharacterised protein [Klebsiella pneumoniae]|nr:hypothetical protein DJICPGNB_15550 [Proteus mirabilis]SSJ78033.1 Uncharacterised protein [Klebsiella pneumoniae]SVJ50722.1 Uncharacterised protein [Klebsiella pneumoniae]